MMYNPDDPDPVIHDDYEANNSFASATDLGTSNSGGLGGLSITGPSTNLDIDYFKFTAASNTTIQVRIDFQHLDGNLVLRAYNGSQQLIGTSDTSSQYQNSETLTFGVQQGQTYFFRVGGAVNYYDLSFRNLTANFDWSMPRRFGSVDQFGLPVIPNTRDYAMPNPTWINGVETARFPVQFTVPGGITGGDVSYNWNIVGSNYSTNVSNAGLTRNIDLPEGTYNVTLTTTAGGVSVSSQQQITVRNYLIVGMGDSYGSGEGNPHSPAQYDWAGFATRGAIWADSPDGQEALYHRMAHRSSKAGAAMAALDLENNSDKSSVTFVFLNHTGATINQGVLNGQPSGEPSAAPGTSPAQISRLSQIVGSRPIDTMIMSIGGNDMGFAQVLRDLVTNENLGFLNEYEQNITDILEGALAKVETLDQVGYPALAAALQPFTIRNTILTEYPDISRDSNGNYGDGLIGDVQPPLAIDRHEITRAMTEVMPHLVETMVRACRKFGWTYGGGLAEQYRTHGYGDWLRTATDSTIMQGPLGNVNFVTVLDKQNTSGTMHPIGGGLEALRGVLNGKLWGANLAMTNFSMSAGALVDNAATFSITIKNTSMLTTAGASTTALYMSPDTSVTAADTFLTSINVPALAPGQQVTLTGSLPTRTDPFRTNANAVYVAPVLDSSNVVAEANEGDNNAYNPALIKAVKSERDLNADGTINPATIAVGQTVNAAIGRDELIGGADFDFYNLDVTAGQTLDIDVDSNSLDTYLAIYSTSFGFLILKQADNDNGFAPGETFISGESYLRHTFNNAGRYVLVVGHAANKTVDPNVIPGRNAGQSGDYSLSVSNVAVTPPPQCLEASYDLQSNTITYRFDRNVLDSISASTLGLKNLDTGATIPSSAISVSKNLANNSVTFSLIGYAKGLPNGNWKATLSKSLVKDAAGIALANDAVASFFSLAGDANRDRKVDFNDLLVLASNFNKTGRTYQQGNFDRSANGTVDFNDLLILAGNFNTSVPLVQNSLVAAQSSDVLDTEKRATATFSEALI